jgi:hypothetical protein
MNDGDPDLGAGAGLCVDEVKGESFVETHQDPPEFPP